MNNFGNFHMIYFYRHNSWKWLMCDSSPDFKNSFITHCPNSYIIKRSSSQVRTMSNILLFKKTL